MSRATGDKLIQALTAAGLCDDTTTRVVIDIRAGYLPVVYTEKIGAEPDMLSVVTALGGVEIRRGGK